MYQGALGRKKKNKIFKKKKEKEKKKTIQKNNKLLQKNEKKLRTIHFKAGIKIQQI